MSNGKNITACFLGTFDPITLGHLEIIEKGAKLFSHLFVGVNASDAKNPIFKSNRRYELTKEVCKKFQNVTVSLFEGLGTEFAKKNGALVLLRGIRNTTDFNYEQQIASVNRILDPSLETIFLPTSPSVSFISSTLVRDIYLHKGSLLGLVPSTILDSLS